MAETITIVGIKKFIETDLGTPVDVVTLEDDSNGYVVFVKKGVNLNAINYNEDEGFLLYDGNGNRVDYGGNVQCLLLEGDFENWETKQIDPIGAKNGVLVLHGLPNKDEKLSDQDIAKLIQYSN